MKHRYVSASTNRVDLAFCPPAINDEAVDLSCSMPCDPSFSTSAIDDETVDLSCHMPAIEHEIDLSFLESAVEQTAKRQLLEKEETIVQLRKKVKVLQENVRRKNLKITKMCDLLTELKKKNFINSEIQNVLSTRFSGVLFTIIQNEDLNMDKKNAKRFDSDILEFASTLNFLSPKAYKYARKHLCLPTVTTLRRHQSVSGNPGWSAESFQALSEHESKDGGCVIIFDAMHLKEHAQFVKVSGGYKAFGYIDHGNGPDENGTLANESLVFIAVGLLKAWRFPLSYFLTRGALTAVQQHALVKEAIIRLHDIGVTVRAIVCDGTSANIATLEMFRGCHLPDTPWFEHPRLEAVRIFATLDASHMVKLARNAFAKGEIQDSHGNSIAFSFVSRLFEVQQQEGLRLANRLSLAHVLEWKKRKMRVKLAVQVLSRSVSDALDFLMRINYHGFSNCEATIKFIRIVDE
jgi:hypothetical protein